MSIGALGWVTLVVFALAVIGVTLAALAIAAVVFIVKSQRGFVSPLEAEDADG